MEENNPWAIDSIFEMQYFNCPSCNFRTQSKQSFVEHAFEEHPESIEFLVKISDGSLDDIDYRWKSRWDQKVEIKPDPEDDESEDHIARSNLDEDIAEKIRNDSNDDLDDDDEDEDAEIYEPPVPKKSKKNLTRKSKKQQLKQVQQKLYSCQICDMNFSVLSKLRSHHQQCKQTADQQKSKQKAVTTSSAVAAPKSAYDTPKNNTSTKTTNIFRCCGVSIDTIETMLEHCQENHSDEMINQNPKMCDKCDLIFPNNRIIDCHSYLDHLVMRWSCSICDEYYHNPRSFNDHDEIEHLGIQKKSLNGNCSMCNYPIKSDVHGGESIREHWFNNHHCKGCGLTFQNENFLSKHKSRSEKCSALPEKSVSLNSRENTSTHQALVKATSETPRYKRNSHGMKLTGSQVGYRCTNCNDVTTKSIDEMMRHVAVMHPEDVKPDLLICHKNPCGQGFSARKVLDSHLYFVHGVLRYTCSECGKYHANYQIMYSHARTCVILKQKQMMNNSLLPLPLPSSSGTSASIQQDDNPGHFMSDLLEPKIKLEVVEDDDEDNIADDS